MMASAGGASLTDAYLATSMLILAIVAGGAAIQMTLRLRTEESAGRAEPLLATPTSRIRVDVRATWPSPSGAAP